MYIQTHILSGWCLGNRFTLSPRERFFCMLAASLPDIDGFGVIISQEFFWDVHHVLGHNLFFGILLCLLLSVFSSSWMKMFGLYLALFHLHLLLDYYGSGPGWGIAYFWPFSHWQIANPHAWPFEGWQNITAGYFCVVWTLWIVLRQQRTPLEHPMPSLDRQLVEVAQKITATLKPGREGGIENVKTRGKRT